VKTEMILTFTFAGMKKEKRKKVNEVILA